jgi:hypothetical protein
MAKGFRPVLRDQAFLLPPDMRDWLPADHLVWFVLDTSMSWTSTSSGDAELGAGSVLPVMTHGCSWAC